jgi:hypothetical protein
MGWLLIPSDTLKQMQLEMQKCRKKAAAIRHKSTTSDIFDNLDKS